MALERRTNPTFRGVCVYALLHRCITLTCAAKSYVCRDERFGSRPASQDTGYSAVASPNGSGMHTRPARGGRKAARNQADGGSHHAARLVAVAWREMEEQRHRLATTERVHRGARPYQSKCQGERRVCGATCHAQAPWRGPEALSR